MVDPIYICTTHVSMLHIGKGEFVRVPKVIPTPGNCWHKQITDADVIS